jgi:DNA helicase TIP49 (TBP-interacting protein)
MAEQTTNQTGATLGEPINEEVGRDEAWFGNIKGQFDAFQQQLHMMFTDARNHAKRVDQIAEQMLQNAITNANVIMTNASTNANKVITDSANIAMKDMLGSKETPIEQAAGDVMTTRGVTIDDASLKAMGAAIAAAVVSALGPKTA